MEENMQHVLRIMLYYFKKGRNATETQKIYLYTVWSRCHDWLNISKVVYKFCAGDFLLDDTLWSGKLVEVDSNQIEKLIKNNQHVGNSQHTQNIQINKVIGGSEK